MKDNLRPRLTRTQILLNDYNRAKAALHFNLQEGYVMHHKDTSLRENDIERYIQWNYEDIEIMTQSEHTKLHNKLRGKENVMYYSWFNNGVINTRAKECPDGFVRGRINFNPNTTKNCHWFNNGVEEKFCKICPEGYTKGRLNNNICVANTEVTSEIAKGSEAPQSVDGE